MHRHIYRLRDRLSVKQTCMLTFKCMYIRVMIFLIFVTVLIGHSFKTLEIDS